MCRPEVLPGSGTGTERFCRTVKAGVERFVIQWAVGPVSGPGVFLRTELMKFRAFLSRRWRYIVYATTPVLVALLASGLTTLQDISPAAAATRVSVALLSLLLILFPTFISDAEDISNQGLVVSVLSTLIAIAITVAGTEASL
ncbi:hypothetical protein [Escherichia coli]|uniref:hypothetical protein n=1 Tax=Escherichia coli TaxID=562 RepID=UPI00211140D7|nr:hypothetical protein [Escherichia coli]MCQ6866989.1 hypothetical protein [Escherichia coli]